jgi:hypothetical protein
MSKQPVLTIVQHDVYSNMSPRKYQWLRFFRLIPDYAVVNDKTLSLCLLNRGNRITLTLNRDTNILDLAGKVGQAAGKILNDWTVYPFQRTHRGVLYNGVITLEK